jgi:hypothetical protein
LGKSLKLRANTREATIAAILKHSQRSGINSFFGQKSCLKSSILLRWEELKSVLGCICLCFSAKGLLGRCFRLSAFARDVFRRAFLLFGLHQARDEESASPSSQMYV